MSLTATMPGHQPRLAFPVFKRLVQDIFSLESAFVIFVFAGLLKKQPFFEQLPVDLTFLSGALVASISVFLVVSRRVFWTIPTLSAAYLGGVFFAYMTTTLLWSPDPSIAVSKAAFSIPLVALSFLVAALIIAPVPDRLRRLLFMTVGLGAYMLIITLQAYRHSVAGIGLDFATTDYISVGRLLGLAWLIVYVDVVTRNRGRALVMMEIVLLAGLGFGLLVTGARQTLTATAIGALLPLVFRGAFSLRLGLTGRRSRILAAALLLASFLSVFGLHKLGVDMNTIDRFTVLFSEGSSSVDVRKEYWSFVLDRWGEHPFFGHGLASFGMLSGITPADHAHPHDVPLELLMEGGLVALGLFLALVLYCVTGFLRRDGSSANHQYASTLLVLVLFSGLSIMVSSSYADDRSFFSLLGLLCVFWSRREAATVGAQHQLGNGLAQG